MTITTSAPTARSAATVRTIGLIAALASVGYGVLAAVFPYPRITDAPFELLWGLINLGYIGTLTAWLRSWPGPVPVLGRVGGAIAIAGLAVRVVDVVWFVVRPEAASDVLVVISILLTFTGLAVLGVASLRGAPRPRRWAPLLVLGVGLVVSSLYGPLPVLHFVALGVVWGASWGLLAASARA
jgi:hypothetical protein